MDTVVYLVKDQLVRSELNIVFPLQLDPSGRGLLDGTTYESFSTVVPDGVPSNVPNLGCLPLQHNTSDGTIAPLSQATYSSNIVVKDSPLQGCISHESLHHSLKVKFSE